MQLQAFFLVADDIMDNSVTRRGQPCWYRLPKVWRYLHVMDSSELLSLQCGVNWTSQSAMCVSEPLGTCYQLLAILQVGLVACNDYIILESCIYRIMKQHLAKHPSYTQFLELFHEVSVYHFQKLWCSTTLGQRLLDDGASV